MCISRRPPRQATRLWEILKYNNNNGNEYVLNVQTSQRETCKEKDECKFN